MKTNFLIDRLLERGIEDYSIYNILFMLTVSQLSHFPEQEHTSEDKKDHLSTNSLIEMWFNSMSLMKILKFDNLSCVIFEIIKFKTLLKKHKKSLHLICH